MPPRNNPAPNAVRLFNCAICDKGYARQVEYENHLRSYDHTHRQRMADLKKLTANNNPESSKPKSGPEMRAINMADAEKKPVMGSRFTKIGGDVNTSATGSRFKKIGVAVESAPAAKEDKKKLETVSDVPAQSVEQEAVAPAVDDAKEENKDAQDIVTEDKTEEAEEQDEEEEEITWEQYDFTKPTGCDHSTCAGCKAQDIWGPGWVQHAHAAEPVARGSCTLVSYDP